MNYIKFKGAPLPATPSTFRVDSMDLDNAEGSGRTLDGQQYRDRIRAGIRRLQFSFGPLKWSEISAIYKLMEDPYFDVTYPDPYSGQFETRTFQVGDREAPFLVSRGGEIYWSGFRFNLVER